MRGYHLPLCQWPTQAAVPVTLTLDWKIYSYVYTYINRKHWQRRFSIWREGAHQEVLSILDQSSICGPQKQRRVATIYSPTADKPVYRSTHFKMEGPYMLPSLLQHLVKVNLKDIYLTVLVAKGSWSLLAFQNQRIDLFQFKVLPFRLYSTLFTSSQNVQSQYHELRLLGAWTYNFCRNFLKILPCLLSTCAYNAICHLWSPHI